ncbi:MAG TPA: PIN domain-containing protein [Gaiellaceae bacterium]|nr:PIN domain-containing protein [Gaiellaceae bacterium]
MGGVYVDTSALGRILLGEPDASAVLETLETFDRHVASRLARVELQRLALRFAVLDQAEQLLRAVALIPVEEALLEAAETVRPESVATLDAIHLVTAIRLADAGAIEAVLTYDLRLADGARHHGLTALAPSAGRA